MAEPASRSRGEITEITHVAPVRAGLVPKDERGDSAPITFADRLKTILEAFNRREDQGFPNVIRMFRGIHTAQWTLIDGDTRLLLNVVFDGDWADYLRALTYEVPALLNLIWSNCEGWQDVDKEPDRLLEFIRAYQVRVSFLYAHHPRLTVVDIDRLLALQQAVENPGLDHLTRAKLYAEVDAALPPKTFEMVRTDLLNEFDRLHPCAPAKVGEPPPLAVEIAKQGFRSIVGRLYSPSDSERALAEAFTRPEPEGPKGGA